MARRQSPLLAVSLGVLYRVSSATAYSWLFQQPPTQCGNVTVTISGTDGRPPYRILIIPTGPSPLANGIEARKIQDIPFDPNANSLSFRLPYPANSQFIAVVSDANGFGTGGTSVAAHVGASSDDSCFDSQQDVSLAWYYSIMPENQFVQCSNTRLFWDPASVRGKVTFQGVIPGGQSFSIPEGPLSQVANQGTGFDWNINLRNGITLFLVGSDDRGMGSGGSVSHVVSAGTSPNGSCLNATSPSSTSGDPAGGSYPTSRPPGSGNSGDSDSGNQTNVGAIVGGVVGGLVAILACLLLLYFMRKRKRERARQREKPLDLLNEDEDGDEDRPNNQNNLPPQFYQAEPFTVPDPTIAGTNTESYQDWESSDGRRPLSGGSTSFYTNSHQGGAYRPGTPEGSAFGGQGVGGTQTSMTRKGAPPRMMRPVNIIQHDDAGPSYTAPKEGEEADTIELPPAYTALKKGEPGA